MKLTIVITVVVFSLMMIPRPVSPTDSQSLPAATWTVEEMQVWGTNNIAIDFGTKGGWSYTGPGFNFPGWIRIRWNPGVATNWR